MLWGGVSHLQSDAAGNWKGILIIIVELNVKDQHLIDTNGVAGWQAVQLGLEGGEEDCVSTRNFSPITHQHNSCSFTKFPSLIIQGGVYLENDQKAQYCSLHVL